MKALFALVLAVSLSACSSGISVTDISTRADKDTNGCIVKVDEKAEGTFIYQSDSCLVQFTK